MTCDTSKFKQGIADLSTALNKENANFNDVNLILDNLNALNLQNSLFTEEVNCIFYYKIVLYRSLFMLILYTM